VNFVVTLARCACAGNGEAERIGILQTLVITSVIACACGRKWPCASPRAGRQPRRAAAAAARAPPRGGQAQPQGAAPPRAHGISHQQQTVLKSLDMMLRGLRKRGKEIEPFAACVTDERPA